MIAVDTNVLVYAHREESPRHRDALARLTELAEGAALWAIPVFCLSEFLRVVTHPRLFDPPYTPDAATLAVRRLLESPSLRVLSPSEAFPEILLDTIARSQARGNLIFDAQIVALCRDAGVDTLLTADGDFARFPGFRFERF